MAASDNLVKSYPYLIVLHQKHNNEEVRRALLKDPCVLLAIRELCYNLLQGNIVVPHTEKEKLKQYKKALLTVVDKNQDPSALYNILTHQRGGSLLGTLLAITLPIVQAFLQQRK